MSRDVETPQPTVTADTPLAELEADGLRLTPGVILVLLVVLASFGVWVYAFSGQADRDPPDLLTDQAFSAAGESICASATSDLERVPNALDAGSSAERAQQIREANVIIGAMADDLEMAAGGPDRDRQLIAAWLVDWRSYLDDRGDYANRIETDPSAQLYIRAVGGERLERRISRFATTNQMPSCITPSDVG